MSIRETINKSPRIGLAVAVVFIVGAVAMIVTQAGSDRPVDPSTAHFSIDDGKTWFNDSAKNIAPYPYDGKEAVRAMLFRCSDGTKFVGYLERLSPEGKKALDDLKARNEMGNTSAISSIFESASQIKRPGDATWLTRNSPTGQKRLAVPCKCGKEIPEVLP